MSYSQLTFADKKFNVKLRYRLFKEARLSNEMLFSALPDENLLSVLVDSNIDIYSFPIRTFLGESLDSISLSDAALWMDNVALLKLNKFDDWWRKIGKKTRNMVRKAEKRGVIVKTLTECSDSVAESLWRIYNETPIRQGRWFKGYGTPKSVFKNWKIPDPKVGELLGAFWNGEMIGFLTLLYGDRVALISQILSMVKHLDKAPNNALIAKAVERCCNRGIRFLIYARMGNHPTLDRFKESNGFVRYPIPRLYVPLSKKGNIAIKLKLHLEPQDLVPEAIKGKLIPLYNLLSRKLRL
ncbi:hypothetical protein DRN86_00150 [Candidatus Geothermarchaeota archaeon]|nr:MAG: hypothetical protein DRN86_00150 [Candidatus Geothermarchaeota archaeon]